MKYFLALMMCAALALSGMPPALCEAADGGEALAEWTLLFYMCGSDLESKHGLATSSLVDLTEAKPMKVFDVEEMCLSRIQWDQLEASGKINVVVETGGCSQWQFNNVLKLDIAEDRLQRYEYRPNEDKVDDDDELPFKLVMEQPLRSMAAPETLADFIRWGAAEYPAKRYGLVLWDHGDGARTGLFADELFHDDVMYLYELDQALDAAGVWFESVVIDACLMANLETGWVLKDHAAYMVASEDLLSGYGTSFSGWLQELYQNPKMNGLQLGQFICDTIEVKYANLKDHMAASTLTYSLIDLSKINRLADCFDRWFALLGEAYERNASATEMMFVLIGNSDHYTAGNTVMVDLGGAFTNVMSSICFGPDFRNEFMDALYDAIEYAVRGNGRTESCGLSFCQAVNLSAEELTVYAKNCPSPHYLALLDALNEDWNAPEWVFEKSPKHTELKTKKEYHPKLTCRMIDGMPALAASYEQFKLKNVYYRLNYLDPRTDQKLLLGMDICNLNLNESINWVFAQDIGDTWPSIDEALCCMNYVWGDSQLCMYNIPVRMEETIYNLRCGYLYNIDLLNQPVDEDDDVKYDGEYKLYGVWEGYNEDTDMPGRDVTSIDLMQGREYQLLYPVEDDSKSGTRFYQNSEPMWMHRGMIVEEMALPEGTYYLTYIVENVFGQTVELSEIELKWDGDKFKTLTPWEGEIEIVDW